MDDARSQHLLGAAGPWIRGSREMGGKNHSPPAACCFSPNFLILYIFLFFSHLTGWEVAQDFTVEDAKAVCELVHRDESLVVEKRRFFL